MYEWMYWGCFTAHFVYANKIAHSFQSAIAWLFAVSYCCFNTFWRNAETKTTTKNKRDSCASMKGVKVCTMPVCDNCKKIETTTEIGWIVNFPPLFLRLPAFKCNKYVNIRTQFYIFSCFFSKIFIASQPVVLIQFWVISTWYWFTVFLSLKPTKRFTYVWLLLCRWCNSCGPQAKNAYNSMFGIMPNDKFYSLYLLRNEQFHKLEMFMTGA